MSSSCRLSKFAAALGFATPVVARQVQLATSSTRRSFVSRIPIPVRISSSVAIPAPSATPSVNRRPLVPTTVSTKVPASSMPKKTGDSIQKHIERLRKSRAAPTTHASASVFSKSKPAVLPPARPRPVPVSVPSDCIVSTMSALSLSASQRPIMNHTERRPVLRSCLKSSRTTKKAPKSVRFIKYSRYNIHRIAVFERDSPPTSFLAPEEAEILPPIDGRTTGPLHVYANTYRLLLPDRQLRLPPPEHDGPVRTGSTDPPRCRPCGRAASRGTRRTRTRPNMQSVWCAGCMADPDKRQWYTPPLVDRGEDDYLDYCVGGHGGRECQYYQSGFEANRRWREVYFSDS